MRTARAFVVLVRVVWIGVLTALLAGCVEKVEPDQSLDTYRKRINALDELDFYQTAYVVDRNGRFLAELTPDGRRTWVPLREISPVLRQAVVATEDRSFYSNTGIDTGAVARAVLQNAQAGETVSGASTITMQLVRLVAFDPQERVEQSLERKVREAHLAAEVAEKYTKDEILEAYLNLAYFGNRAYGAEAAARTYFATSALDLTPAQATLLAGILQAPSALDPFSDLAAARERQRIVLASMVKVGALSESESQRIWSEALGFVVETEMPERRAPHFVDYVMTELPERLGADVVARGGFTVTTSLDLDYNDRVQAIAAEHVSDLRRDHDLTDAAVVAVRPGTGEIVAMVGGIDYDEPVSGQVNVTISHRQIGSAFKPITYAAALDDGWTAADVLWDIPLEFDQGSGEPYRPVNYDGKYRGPVRLREALAGSLNAASVGLLADIGLPRVHALAREMGLTLDPDPSAYGLSLTLGGAEVRLLDVTGAYAAFAAGGLHVRPTSIVDVVRVRDGRSIYRLDPMPASVVSPQTAFLITDILSDREARRVSFGMGGPLDTSRPTAVKTGTTNDFRDNLTIGFTPYLAIGVWAGNKDGRPMRDVLGITGAAPVWHDAMEELFRSEELLVSFGSGDYPPFAFTEPAGIVRAPICDRAADSIGAGCATRTEAFAADHRTGDVGAAFDTFLLRRIDPGDGAGSLQCAVRDLQGSRMLLPPHRGDLAAQVRHWATAGGYRVAPPLCSEVSDAGSGAPHPAVAAAPGPSRSAKP